MSSEKTFEELVNVGQKIISNYFRENSVVSVKELKQKFNNILKNPFWTEEKVREMLHLLSKKNLSSQEQEALIRKMEEMIDELYSKYIKDKPYLLPKEMKKYEQGLIEFFRKTGDLKGQSEVFSTILGYLMIHKNLTQEQLRNLSNYSKGAISINLKPLVKSGFVKKKLIKGERKYLYSLEGKMGELASHMGLFKAELNRDSLSFINRKMEELALYEGEEGKERLTNQLLGILNYLNMQKKALMTILQSEYIKNL